MSLRVILACFCVVEAPPTCKIALSKEQCDRVCVEIVSFCLLSVGPYVGLTAL